MIGNVLNRFYIECIALLPPSIISGGMREMSCENKIIGRNLILPVPKVITLCKDNSALGNVVFWEATTPFLRLTDYPVLLSAS